MTHINAVRVARLRSKSPHPTDAEGYCLRQVRECFGVGNGADDAIGAWNEAKFKHSQTDPRKIPRDVPVFWSGGSHCHGHIAISTGWFARCYSTDILRAGYFDRVGIEEIHDRWDLTLLGWTEDLNGVRVYGK